MKLQQVKRILNKHRAELASSFSVKSLFVFGSVARNESKKTSDIDLLVEFSNSDVGLFEFVDLKAHLESILKQKVDLVTRDAIKKNMLDKIDKESVRVA